MNILLDENLDWRLRRELPGHTVDSVPLIGWAGLKNGVLLAAAAAGMIERRRKANASEAYPADLRFRTSRFINAFPGHPASVTTADRQRYLNGLEGASSTRNVDRQLFWPRGVAWKERERTMTAAQNATAEAARLLPWRHNGLRHAFCS